MRLGAVVFSLALASPSLAAFPGLPEAAGLLLVPSWSYAYNGGSNDLARDVAVDASGNVWWAGSTYESGGWSALVGALDSSGRPIWESRFRLTGHEVAERLAPLPGGGAVAVGVVDWVDGHFFARRFSPDGAVVWTTLEPGLDFMHLLAATLDDAGRIVAGGHQGDGSGSGTLVGVILSFEPDGRLAWRLQTGFPVAALAPVPGGGIVAVTAPLQGGVPVAVLVGPSGEVLAERRVGEASRVLGTGALLGDLVVVAALPRSFALTFDLSVAWESDYAAGAAATDGDRGLLLGRSSMAALAGSGVPCWVSFRPLVFETAQASMFTYGLVPGQETLLGVAWGSDGSVVVAGERWSGGPLGMDVPPGVFGFWDAYVASFTPPPLCAPATPVSLPP